MQRWQPVQRSRNCATLCEPGGQMARLASPDLTKVEMSLAVAEVSALARESTAEEAITLPAIEARKVRRCSSAGPPRPTSDGEDLGAGVFFQLKR